MVEIGPSTLSIEDRLQIERACYRLVTEYAHCLDSRHLHPRRLDDWEMLFAEDAVLTVAGAAQRGRAAIRASIKMGERVSFHSNSNILINAVSHDQARGFLFVTVFFAPLDEGIVRILNPTASVIGFYRDMYRRVEGTWRFAEREFVITMGGIPA